MVPPASVAVWEVGVSAKGVGVCPGGVCQGCLPGVSARGCLPGQCLPRGFLPGGGLAWGVCPRGVYPGGCLPGGVHLPLWTEWQTDVKTLPCPELHLRAVIKRARSCQLLCKRPGCYHSANKTHVRDRIFKLSPIHASLIYQIPWIFLHLGKTPLTKPQETVTIPHNQKQFRALQMVAENPKAKTTRYGCCEGWKTSHVRTVSAARTWTGVIAVRSARVSTAPPSLKWQEQHCIFTARKRSLGQGKVLHLSVILFKGRDWLPSMHHRSHNWGVCIQGSLLGGSASRGLPPRGGSALREVCIRGGWVGWADPRYIGYYGVRSTSGSYACYWDVFLFPN